MARAPPQAGEGGSRTEVTRPFSVSAAATRIGKGAQERAFALKKLELAPFPLYTPYMAYAAAVSDRAALQFRGGQGSVHQEGDQVPTEWVQLNCKTP
jgi:hypothetical protein